MFITIAVFLPALHAEVKLTELVQRNADDSLMLKCEAEEESGKDFIIAREDHVYLLERYLGHMKKRFLSRLLQPLYPELSPETQLRPIVGLLRDEEGDARKEIQATVGTIREFFRNSEKSSEIQIVSFKPEVLSEELLGAINEALNKSHEDVNKYEQTQTVDNAETACRANRRAIALLYLARFDYRNFDDKKLKQLRQDVDRTIYYNGVLERSASTSPKNRNLLRMYSKSEHRRLQIIQAILDSNMLEAKRLLETAIEEARKEKMSG